MILHALHILYIIFLFFGIYIFLFGFEFFKNEKNYIDKLVPYYKEIQEINIPNKIFEKNCDKYKFDEINKTFYTKPKFLFPQEACMSQCMQGVWFGEDGIDHTSDKRGHLTCCEKACKSILP